MDISAFYKQKFDILIKRISVKYPTPCKKYKGYGLTANGVKSDKKCWTRTYGLFKIRKYRYATCGLFDISRYHCTTSPIKKL